MRAARHRRRRLHGMKLPAATEMCALRLVLLLEASVLGSSASNSDTANAAQPHREVCLWLNPEWMNMSWHRQTLNQSWQIAGVPIIDCIYLMCGPAITVDPNGRAAITMNETQYEQQCGAYVTKARALGIKVHTFLTDVPKEALADPSGMIESGIALASKHGWSGYNIDDESECAPRADLHNFTLWVHGLDQIQQAWAVSGLQMSVDVQAVWGILPGPYQRHSPCQKAPWDFAVDAGLEKLLRNSTIDRWVSMDTYFPEGGRFEGQVDWWVDMVGAAHFTPGISGGYGWEDPPLPSWEQPEGFVSRMRAVHDRNITQLAFWMGMVREEWLPWLYRWKTHCRNCPNAASGGATMACFEMQADCGEPRPKNGAGTSRVDAQRWHSRATDLTRGRAA